MIRIELSSKSLDNRTFQVNNNSSFSENPFLYKLLGAKDYEVPEGIFDFVICPGYDDIKLLKKLNTITTTAVPALDLAPKFYRYPNNNNNLKFKLMSVKNDEDKNSDKKDNFSSKTETIRELNNTKSYAPAGYWLRDWSSKYWSSKSSYNIWYRGIDKNGSEKTEYGKIKNGVRPEIIINLKKKDNPWKKDIPPKQDQ